MKINVFKTCLAVLAAALISYALSLCECFQDNLLFPIGVFILLSIILLLALAVGFTWLRTMANVKILSWVFFALVLVLNVIYAHTGVAVSTFIISNGLIMLFYALIDYSISRNNKN